MSLKTRCPACDTVFKIVPDQLKVSKGWVRCGRCAEVFDAAAHTSTALSDNKTQWPQTSIPTSSTAVSTNKNAPNIIAAQATNTPSTATLPSKNEVKNRNLTENKLVIHKEAGTPPDVSPDLSFVRVAKNKAFWQRAAVTRTLSATCIGLAGLLFVQVVYSQRNHLAASNPALKSGLDTICQTVGCAIEPHKNIDAFKIESSSFQKIPATHVDNVLTDSFALKLSLKNNAEIPLAIPAVELTLTEAGDKPVLRRVLMAKDLGNANATLAANGDWAGAATVLVSPNPAMPPISGYRVLLFYP